jgi:bifunctional DNA-binding transcriptional regulator/antitoxin component of YhaV-PrlF toxin-antitoxin module
VTDTPYGPIKITPNRQVSLPKELMDRARLQPGDRVYVSWNDQLDNTLVVIPIEIVAEWIRRGQQADAPARTELPSTDPPV